MTHLTPQTKERCTIVRSIVERYKNEIKFLITSIFRTRPDIPLAECIVFVDFMDPAAVGPLVHEPSFIEVVPLDLLKCGAKHWPSFARESVSGDIGLLVRNLQDQSSRAAPSQILVTVFTPISNNGAVQTNIIKFGLDIMGSPIFNEKRMKRIAAHCNRKQRLHNESGMEGDCDYSFTTEELVDLDCSMEGDSK